MNQELKRVNPTELKMLDKVFVSIPKADINHKLTYNNTVGFIHSITDEFNEFDVMVWMPGYCVCGINVKYLYYPPTEQQSQEDKPVLIELDEVLGFFYSEDRGHTAKQIEKHFSKPENQYQPKEEKPSAETMIQAVSSEWVPEKDDIAVNQNGRQVIVLNYLKDDQWPVKVKHLDNNEEDSYWLHMLTLVKKADKSAEAKSETKPFLVGQYVQTLVHAPNKVEWFNNWYTHENQGKEHGNIGKIKYIDKLGRYYVHGLPWQVESLKLVGEDELKEKQLPMSWEELDSISGYYIMLNSATNNVTNANPNHNNKNVFPTEQDAQAALATAQLLQLRKAWLDIEAPGWVPNWFSIPVTDAIIKRQHEHLEVVTDNRDWSPFSFPSQELAEKFKDTFTDLLKTAFCLPVE